MNIKPDKEIEKGDNIVNIGGRNTHRVWEIRAYHIVSWSPDTQYISG
jgi:hypothetical protein